MWGKGDNNYHDEKDLDLKESRPEIPWMDENIENVNNWQNTSLLNTNWNRARKNFG